MAELNYYLPIVSRYTSIFRQPPDLEINEKQGVITELDGRNSEYHFVVKITFYLKSSYYGETKMRIREWYNEDGEKVQYRYQWEKNNTKPGHISAWENERHKTKLVETDPLHHHHVPADRKRRQELYTLRNLENVMKIVKIFIEDNKEYDGKLL